MQTSDLIFVLIGHQLGEIARDHDRQGVLAGGRPRLGSSHCIDQSALARSPCRILIVSQQLRPVRDYVFQDGKSVVWGKSGSVRRALGGRSLSNKNKQPTLYTENK